MMSFFYSAEMSTAHCLIIKKIQRPSVAERFKDLSNKVEERFKNNKLKEDVVDEAIKWARK